MIGKEQSRGAPPAGLAALADSGTEGLVVVDEARQIALFNSGAEALLGYSASELLGQPLDSIFSSPGSFNRLAERAQGPPLRELARTSQGAEITLEVSASRLALNGQTMTALFLKVPSDNPDAAASARLAQAHILEILSS